MTSRPSLQPPPQQRTQWTAAQLLAICEAAAVLAAADTADSAEAAAVLAAVDMADSVKAAVDTTDSADTC